jgi:hypothetical protein
VRQKGYDRRAGLQLPNHLALPSLVLENWCRRSFHSAGCLRHGPRIRMARLRPEFAEYDAQLAKMTPKERVEYERAMTKNYPTLT